MKAKEVFVGVLLVGSVVSGGLYLLQDSSTGVLVGQNDTIVSEPITEAPPVSPAALAVQILPEHKETSTPIEGVEGLPIDLESGSLIK